MVLMKKVDLKSNKSYEIYLMVITKKKTT